MVSAPVKGAIKACNGLARSRRSEVTEIDFLRELLSAECLAVEAFAACIPVAKVLQALDSIPAERKHFDPFENIRESMDAVLPGHSELVKRPGEFEIQQPAPEYKERPPEPDHVPSDVELEFNRSLLRDLEAARVVAEEFSDPLLRPDHIFLTFLRRPDSEIRRHLVSDGQDVEQWVAEMEKSLRAVEPYLWKSKMHHEVGDLLPRCHVLPEIEEWWKREDGTTAEPGDADFEEVAATNEKRAYDQPYSEMLWLKRIFVHDDSQFGQLYGETSYREAYYEGMRNRFE
jgi:hypothetical protein